MVYLCLIAYVVVIYVRPGEIWTDFPFVEALVGVSLGAAGLSYLARPRAFWDLPHDWFILGFWIAIVTSNLFGGWLGGAAWGFSEFFKVAFYYFLIRFAVREEWQFQGLVRTLIVVNVVLAVSGIIQFHWGAGLGGITVEKTGRIRGSGIFNDPNDLALSLVMVVPFLLDPIVDVTRRFGRRLLALSFLAAVTLALYYTNSRSGVLSFAVILCLYVFRRYGRVSAAVMMAGLLIATLAWGPSRLRTYDASTEASTVQRVRAWHAALVVFESHPLVGAGFGRFREFHVRTAHNSFAHVLAELGMLGAFFWVGIYYWQFKGALARPPTEDAFAERWKLPLVLSLVGVLVSSWFLSRQYVLYPYTLVGIGACYASLARARGAEVDLDLSARAVLHILSIVLAGIAATYFATRLF